jgi:hypothetical protein
MKIRFPFSSFTITRRGFAAPIEKVEPALAPTQEDKGTWLAPSMTAVMSMRWRIIELGEKLDQARHRLALAYNHDEAKSARIEELETLLAQRNSIASDVESGAAGKDGA